jgi:hypothetical protein
MPKKKYIKNNYKTVIMITEDDEINFLYLAELFNNYNCRIIHAKDGQEAVDLFKENPDISLILMDIKMPKMNGYNAAKIIKAIKPNLPIIAQSAYALENEIAEYINIFDDYLTKPIKSNDLKNVVQRYVELKII